LNVEGEIMEINILAKFIKSYPCSRCNEAIGEAKAKICGACGEARHVTCMNNKPGVGYWFCPDCSPKFMHGHEDAALNVPLHNLLRGSDTYPGIDKSTRNYLKMAYRFMRGCLIWTTE
jgi:hypothetical protein